MSKHLDKILKEELLHQELGSITTNIAKYSTPNITIYNKHYKEENFLYFVFIESVHLDGYKDEIKKFPELLKEFFSKVKGDENILVKKRYDDRYIYLGKGFNEESELVEYCKSHKLGDYIDVESGKIEDVKDLAPAFDLGLTKKDVTYPPELLSKLTMRGDLVQLYHYGNEELENGELDPKFYKKNIFTTDTYGQPRIFFYIKREDREKVVYGHEYIVEVPLNDLYPFNSDPLYLLNDAIREYGNKQVPVAYQILYITEQAIKLGFKGMFFKWNSTYRVDYFEPIKPINI